MIVSAILYALFGLFSMVMSVISDIMSLAPITMFDTLGLSEDLGYLFGNIWLLNSFLPIAEFINLAGLALSFKLSMFIWKVAQFTMSSLLTIKSTFLRA